MKKIYVIYAGVISILALSMTVAATTVTVNPQSQPVWEGDTFLVTIKCEPTEPVKAWETKFNFDKSFVHVSNVAEGNLFGTYVADSKTFFSPGTIDNSNGNIISLFDLIIGEGMVQDPGSMITINMVADHCGLAALELADTAITNSEQYIPVETANSQVVVHSIYDVVPDNVVNLIDVVSVAGHYGQSGTPGWIPQDVNNDGYIRIMDLVLVVVHMFSG